MPLVSRKRVLRASIWFGLAFVLLFLLRLAYGYLPAGPHTQMSYDNVSDYFSNISNLRKNYASENVKLDNVLQNKHEETSQKYEKTATVNSKSSHFEEDEVRIRKTTGAFGGSIQYEESSGKPGNRDLYLSIGVKPDAFDSFYHAVQLIGDLKATSITKVDKTNEYRQLNAKKATLEKALASLNELKSRGGDISDFVSLNDKIQELEAQLQELGVNLGNYNSENEFCTLHFSLTEGKQLGARGISIFQRIKVAFEWTIKYYVLSMAGLFGVLFCSFIALMILDKLAVWKEKLKL